MKARVNLTAILALLVLGLALYEFFRPAVPFRIGPGTLVLIALLLAVRYAIRRQALKRARGNDDVPKRPLGLS